MSSRDHRANTNEPARYQVVLRESVYQDAQAIGEYISRSHPLNGERYVLGLLTSLESLALLPNAHPRSSAFPDLEIRYLVIGSHRAFYRVIQSTRTVEVLSLIHAKRGLAASVEQIKSVLRGEFDPPP